MCYSYFKLAGDLRHNSQIQDPVSQSVFNIQAPNCQKISPKWDNEFISLNVCFVTLVLSNYGFSSYIYEEWHFSVLKKLELLRF